MVHAEEIGTLDVDDAVRRMCRKWALWDSV